MSEYLVYYRKNHRASDEIRQILDVAQQQGLVQMLDIDVIKQKYGEQGKSLPSWMKGIPLLAQYTPRGIPPHTMGTAALQQARMIARNVHSQQQQAPPPQHTPMYPQHQQYEVQQRMNQRYQEPAPPQMGNTAEDDRLLSTSELYPISNRPKRGEPRALRDPSDDFASSGGSVPFSTHGRNQSDVVGFLAGKSETGKITSDQIARSMRGMPT